LVQDIIISKRERESILDNKYRPLFKFRRNISNKDDIISKYDTILEEIKTIKLSKYRKKLSIYDFMEMLDDDYIINNKDVSEIEEDEKLKVLEHLNIISTKLVDISVNYLLPENLITSTPFDDRGVLRNNVRSGLCIFPYLDKTTYKLNYRCIKNAKGLFICPIELDIDKKPIQWSYCPENPEITKKRKGVTPIETVGDKDKKFYKDMCQFPYMKEENNLIFECSEDVDESGKKYTWCPVKLKKGDVNKNPVPIAATEFENIWTGKWKNKEIYHPKSFDLNPNYLRTLKKGYCQPPESKKTMKKMKTNSVDEIKLEDYNPLNCTNTPSKGGYSRTQLYDFGKNVLKIPHTLLKSGDTTLPKNELCEIINTKYNVFVQDKIYNDGDYYKKDIDKCYNGESKGGYKLQEVREIAIKYYNLDSSKAYLMKKDEICDYIIPFIKKSKISNDDNTSVSDIRLIDIKDCNKTPNRGGYKLSELRDIALKLELSPRLYKNKPELCKLVVEKLKEIRTHKTQSEDNNDRFNDDTKLSKRITTEKLKKIKTLSELSKFSSENIANTSTKKTKKKTSKTSKISKISKISKTSKKTKKTTTNK